LASGATAIRRSASAAQAAARTGDGRKPCVKFAKSLGTAGRVYSPKKQPL
jgi:hypothetical protein